MERGFMKPIEDAFQAIAEDIANGAKTTISDAEKSPIDHFYALWHARSRHRYLESQEVEMRGVRGGAPFSQEIEEDIESHGGMFGRSNMFPRRFLNGLHIQTEVDRYVMPALRSISWRVVRAETGEFLVPDVPNHTMIPITPSMCIAAGAADGVITRTNVAKINRAHIGASQEYIFARDFSACPAAFARNIGR
jgi:hypothetical protein